MKSRGPKHEGSWNTSPKDNSWQGSFQDKCAEIKESIGHELGISKSSSRENSPLKASQGQPTHSTQVGQLCRAKDAAAAAVRLRRARAEPRRESGLPVNLTGFFLSDHAHSGWTRVDPIRRSGRTLVFFRFTEGGDVVSPCRLHLCRWQVLLAGRCDSLGEAFLRSGAEGRSPRRSLSSRRG